MRRKTKKGMQVHDDMFTVAIVAVGRVSCLNNIEHWTVKKSYTITIVELYVAEGITQLVENLFLQITIKFCTNLSEVLWVIVGLITPYQN